MRTIKTMVMLLGLTSWAASGNAQQDLPFSDGFEDQVNGVPLTGASPWSFDIAPIPTNSPLPKDGSDLSVYAADGMSLELDGAADNAPYSNVWFHCYAKVRVHTTEPEIGSAAAAFFIDSQRNLKAYSNNTFVVVSENVSTNDWLGFSVHLDYKTDTWDLYRTPNGYSFGDNLVKQNGAPMAFNAAYVHADELAEVEISGETYLDAAVLAESQQTVDPGTASPGYTAGNSDGVELTLNEAFTGVLLSYFGGSGAMNGEFGEALGSLLLPGDQVGIFVPTSSPPWQVFTYNGPGQVWTHDGDDNNTNPTITPTTAVYVELDPDAVGTRSPAFVVAFDSTTSHTEADPTTIYGTNSAARGWNMLSLPFTAGPRSITFGDGSALGLDDAAAEGDRIYLRKNGQWLQVMTFRNGLWVRGRTPVSESFPAGSGFWYRRNATGTATWGADTEL